MRVTRNKDLLLQISSSGRTDRTALSEKNGLTLSGAKRLVDGFLEKGLIKRVGAVTPAKGRPSEFFDFNPEFGCLGALEIGRMYCKAALFDFQGEPLEQEVMHLDFSRTPAWHLQKLSKLLFTWAGCAKSRKILSLGIAAGGVVDAGKGTISHLHETPEWRSFDLTRVIPGTPLPQALVSYATAGIIAEYNKGVLQSHKGTALFFHFGSNVVASIMVDGRCELDSGTPYGHIGHIPLDGNKAVCYCGRQGCAETLISSEGILEQYAVALKQQNLKKPAHLTLEMLIASAAQNEPVAFGLLEKSVRIAGKLLAPSVNLLSPDILVLSGLYFFENPDLTQRLTKVLKAELTANAFYRSVEKLNIAPSALGNEAIISGAAVAARNAWIAAQ